MPDNTTHFYWDSCVFIALLNDENAAYDVDSIHQYLDEAKAGKHLIYASTLSIAEIRPSHMVKSEYDCFSSFVEDMKGAVVLIDASPNLIEMAGQLRDLPYQKQGAKRGLSTPDAVQLATALHLSDAYEVKVSAFHTFDNGKRRGPEGKCVPLLTFEQWCEGFQSDTLASRVIALTRCKPHHPEPKMFGGRGL